MRSIMTGLLVAAVVAAGAVWLANRSSDEAEVQPVGHAPDPVATDDAMTHPGPELSRTSDLPGPAPVEIDPSEPALADRDELDMSDPPLPAAGGPVLYTAEPAPDATVRDELLTVPVDTQEAPAGRPELETVPADVQESARRGELTDAPEPGQGSTSTR